MNALSEALLREDDKRVERLDLNPEVESRGWEFLVSVIFSESHNTQNTFCLVVIRKRFKFTSHT